MFIGERLNGKENNNFEEKKIDFVSPSTLHLTLHYN